MKDVVRAQDVGTDGLHREKLTRRNLLKGCCMEDVVHAMHGIAYGLIIPYVTDVKLYLSEMIRIASLKLMAHIVLLLLVAGEDANLAHVGG